MGFLASGLFWGIVLVLLGLSVILKAVFHVDLPVFRLVLAGALIFLGVRLLVGGGRGGGEQGASVLFGERALDGRQPHREFSVVFGKGSLDLTGLGPADRPEPLSFVTVFGSGLLRLDPAVPAKVTLTSAFGAAQAPDGTQIAFGSYVYRTAAYQEGQPFLDIRATVVFGEVRVAVP